MNVYRCCACDVCRDPSSLVFIVHIPPGTTTSDSDSRDTVSTWFFIYNINATTTKDLCPSRFCASFIYGAKKSTFYYLFFFHKKRICTKFNWFHPRATRIIHVPPNVIHYKYKLYGSHYRCLHKQLISNEGLSTYKHVIRVLNIVYKWWISADIKIFALQ